MLLSEPSGNYHLLASSNIKRSLIADRRNKHYNNEKARNTARI